MASTASQASGSAESSISRRPFDSPERRDSSQTSDHTSGVAGERRGSLPAPATVGYADRDILEHRSMTASRTSVAHGIIDQKSPRRRPMAPPRLMSAPPG